VTRAAATYLMGVSCLALGLAVSCLQSYNHALADDLQNTERMSLDMEVRIEALETECVVEVHRALAGEPVEIAVDATFADALAAELIQ